MQLIICDDDNLFIQKLQSYLQLFFRQHHLTLPEIITFTSGEELLSYTGRIDILFPRHRNARNERNLRWKYLKKTQ